MISAEQFNIMQISAFGTMRLLTSKQICALGFKKTSGTQKEVVGIYRISNRQQTLELIIVDGRKEGYSARCSKYSKLTNFLDQLFLNYKFYDLKELEFILERCGISSEIGLMFISCGFLR